MFFPALEGNFFVRLRVKALLHVLQISSGVSLRLHIFVILGWNTSKLHYSFRQDFFSSQSKNQFVWIKIMVFMISFVKILMALKIKDQNFWFLSQSQEDISNKLFVLWWIISMTLILKVRTEVGGRVRVWVRVVRVVWVRVIGP